MLRLLYKLFYGGFLTFMRRHFSDYLWLWRDYKAVMNFDLSLLLIMLCSTFTTGAIFSEKCEITHTVLMTIFPGEPRLAGCPLIHFLHLFLDCASFWNRPKLSMSFLTQSHQVFFRRPLSNSFNFPRYTMFDPVISSFSFNMSKPS